MPVFKLPPLKESEIEIAVCHLLRVNEFCFWKQTNRGYFDVRTKRFRKDHNPYTGRGVPDLMMIYRGYFIGLEIKTKKGVQSDDQKEFQAKCMKAGGFYFVIRSVEEAKLILDAVCLEIHKLTDDIENN